MNLEAHLPQSFRGLDIRTTNMSDGLSGAGVYRVEAGDQVYVLKVAPEQEARASWQRALEIRRRAAAAGLAPALVHVDEERRSFLTELVIDRSFSALYRDPRTHERALSEIAHALRRLHAIPIPLRTDDPTGDAAPWTRFPESWAALSHAAIAVPDFVREAAETLLAEAPPLSGCAPVLSHNDVHPKNLVHDGERLYLMDWDAAGPNDPFYDLATIAVFLGMDGPTCRKLLRAYEGAQTTGVLEVVSQGDMPLPARFLYDRRLIATLCGVGFIQFGFHRGYTAGAATASGQTLASTPALGEFYQQMRTGTMSLATGEGCWAFGLALVRESMTPV